MQTARTRAAIYPDAGQLDGQRLGEFQYSFLKAVLKLEDDAFGPRIQAMLENAFGERINPGQIYSTADRLVLEGLLTTEEGRVQKNGRPATLFACTNDGLIALEATKQRYKRLLDL
jgi:DNA-binding PadR family transcriptional regulator